MRRVTSRFLFPVCLLVAGSTLLLAHDMFLKPAQFFVGENSPLDLILLNGTFSKSENAIARNRLVDISVVSPAGRARVDTSQWKATGDTSAFSIRTGAAGTYVLGVSTRPNIIALKGPDFNSYLKDDGIPDVLAARTKAAELDKPARERYQKHVKAMVQVGATRSDAYGTVLGYPAEIVPLENPYGLKVGATLRVRTQVDGTPTTNQYVQFGGRTPDGGRIPMKALRTDAAGVAVIPLSSAGVWYIKFISMKRLSGDPDADYESKWATLTFAVK